MSEGAVARWTRRAGLAGGGLLAGVVLFDLAAYLAFPGLVQTIQPEYANDIPAEVRREAAENPYFRAHEERGFDIRPGARTVFWKLPDVAPYEIWGNGLGCFDAEPQGDAAPDIYLAGDSFTWGFSSYDTLFGTILERRTGLLVHACGVPHTGQRHQFDKFLEIAEAFRGWPALVVVNVFTNDIANDFAHPHSTVIDGGLVDTVVLTRGEDGLSTSPAPPYRKSLESGTLRDYLKTYSATANIANVIVRDYLEGATLGRFHIYDAYEPGTYPVRERIAVPHREAIARWIAHARRNGYALRFALIPGRDDFGRDVYGAFRDFLAEAGGVAWDFESHVLSSGIRPEDLYWPVSYHFNPQGNAAYADFLLEMLGADAGIGRLPPGFAGARPDRGAP